MNDQIRLHHGDYQRVLSGVKADLIFTSPPYNIGSKSPRKDGYRKQGRYDPKSYGAIRDYPDALPEEDYQTGQVKLCLWVAAHLTPNGIFVYNHKPRRKGGRMIHPAEWFSRLCVRRRLTLVEEIIWDRGSTHNHCRQLMWPRTERLYVFKPVHGVYQLDNHEFSDVWRINSAKRNGHNAPFPLDLATRVVQLWSQPGELVCDPHMGSGTTARACQILGRRFEGAEILDRYYDQSKHLITGEEGVA